MQVLRQLVGVAADLVVELAAEIPVGEHPDDRGEAARITHVSSAEPPASRQRIGIDLYAENVARAADRM